MQVPGARFNNIKSSNYHQDGGANSIRTEICCCRSQLAAKCNPDEKSPYPCQPKFQFQPSGVYSRKVPKREFVRIYDAGADGS